MNTRRLITVLVVAVCVGCDGEVERARVEVGQSKDAIRGILGEPDETTTHTKQNEHIWGPEEAFWDEIAMGAELEVWTYRLDDGQLNLYFVDGSDELSFRAFAPTGVVYESADVSVSQDMPGSLHRKTRFHAIRRGGRKTQRSLLLTLV